MQDQAERLLEIITGRDFGALETVLAPDVHLRALLPDGLTEVRGSAAIATSFSHWFGTLEAFDVLEATTETIGDRAALRYRFRVRRPDEVETVITQQLILIGTNDSAETIHLVCSGFRPAHPMSPAETHDFDAGDLGCGDGLTAAFKQEIKGISVGDLLRVHTIDPSAKEDLPSLARLMGHAVQSIEAHAGGGFVITVERNR